MKKIFKNLFLLILSVILFIPVANAISQEKIVNFHLQLGDWPERYRPMMEKIVSDLVASDGCWRIKESTKSQEIELVTEAGSSSSCSRFTRFKSEDSLKPWKRNATDLKYFIYHFDDEGMPKAGIKLFGWNGKKMRRVGSSGFKLEGKSEEFIRDHLILWTLK